MPRPRKRLLYNKDRQTVLGVYYQGGRRQRVKIAGFAELGIPPSGNVKRKNEKARIAAELDRRYWATEAKIGAAETPRVSEGIKALLQRWLDVSAAYRMPGTVKLNTIISNDWMATIGDIGLKSVKPKHVDDLAMFWGNRGLAPATINIRLRTLRVFFGWVAEQNSAFRPPRVRFVTEPERVPIPTPENTFHAVSVRIAQLQSKGQSAKQRWFYHLHARCWLLFGWTGMRRQEVFFLRWQDVQLERGEIQLKAWGEFRPKGRRERIVYMPSTLRRYLQRVREKYPHEIYMLDNGQGEIAISHPHALTVAFRRHIDATAPTMAKPLHGLRARHATRLRELNVDLEAIRGILGHQDISTTAGYFGPPKVIYEQAMLRLDPSETPLQLTPELTPTTKRKSHESCKGRQSDR